MKKLLTLFLVSVMALPVITTSFVQAVEDNQTDETLTTETTTGTTADVTNKQALANRIAEHKELIKTKISNAKKLRIQSKCKAAQGKVSSVEGRIKGLETSRAQVYKNIINRLTKLSEKLKAKEVDTTELNADIVVLQEKMTKLNTDLAEFKQIVGDLAAMDCATDPDGFNAALEAARTARQQVHQDGLDVRAYINDTIKPLLKTIREQLATTETEGGQ